nr:hypothetical protein [Tanacetum cinerariifolium]
MGFDMVKLSERKIKRLSHMEGQNFQTFKQRLSDMEGYVERRKGSLNLNMETTDDEEDDVQEVQRSMDRDEERREGRRHHLAIKKHLARLMVKKYASLGEPYNI